MRLEQLTAFLTRFRGPLIATLALVLVARGCTKGGDSTEKKATSGEAAAGKEEKKDEHHDEVKLSAEAIKKYEIKIEDVTRRSLTPTILAPARVSFNTEAMAHVGAVLRGRVVELKVRRGDLVKAGDELLSVESPELGEAQSDYLQKQTALTVAGPAVELTKSAYDRAKSLFDGSKGITLTDLQKREADLKTAQGALQSAQAAATAAENKLHLLGMTQAGVEALSKSKEIKPRYSITSPIDGQVIEREVTLGELVSPEKEALLVITDVRTLWVLADVPETRLPEIAQGSSARVTVAAVGTTPIQGTVSFIESSLDPNTRTGRVRIEVKGDDAKAVRPGMFAQAEIAVTPLKGEPPAPVLAIPDDAVQTVEGATAVFVPVPGEPNTFAKRVVSVGAPVAGMVPVLKGLKEGDKIVSSGSFVMKAELGRSEAGDE